MVFDNSFLLNVAGLTSASYFLFGNLGASFFGPLTVNNVVKVRRLHSKDDRNTDVSKSLTPLQKVQIWEAFFDLSKVIPSI